MLVTLLVAAQRAAATPANKAALEKHFDRFLARPLAHCNTCHLPSDTKFPQSLGEFPHNPFGDRLRKLGEEWSATGRRKDIPARIAVIAAEDSDGDGVIDPNDKCPGTPAGTKVDADGCPVDGDADGDGVKDSKDQCPGTPAGAKVNDVLVAAMTGALRTYLKGRGVDVNNTTLRAMVPVDLRPPERMGQLGNEFGLVVLDLAVTKARADHRLALTKARMDALKHSPEPLATRALLDLMGRLPKVLEDFSNDLFGRKASLVMTNVTGPREELYLAGAPIERMLAWAPHPGKQLGMAVSIFSYKGMAGLTVIGDAHLVPDPETITEEFNREFRKMQKTIATADAAAAKVAKPKAPAKKAVASKPPAKKAPVKAPAPKATAKARPATAKAAAKAVPAPRAREAKPAAKATRK